MTQKLLMPKATAIWLVENSSLSFDQIATFCNLHFLEVKAIADGESGQGIMGLDPIMTGQLSRDELVKAQENLDYIPKLAETKVMVPTLKRKSPRYTPLSKRQDRPNAILWLLRNHPELRDAQISRLVGTTKSTIQAIRDRTHWNSSKLSPMDPVILGLCTQINLDMEVLKAAKYKPAPLRGDEKTLLPVTDMEKDAPVPEPSIAEKKKKSVLIPYLQIFLQLNRMM